MTPAARLSAAFELIDTIDAQRVPAAKALKEWGTAHRYAGSGDRAAISGLVWDVLRRRASSAWIMDDDTPTRATATGLKAVLVQRQTPDTMSAALAYGKVVVEFDSALLGTFLGAELGRKATIDFEGETGFGQFDRSAGHSESVVIDGMVSDLVTVSPAWPTRLS